MGLVTIFNRESSAGRIMRVPVNVNSNANLLNSQFIVLLITKYSSSNIWKVLGMF